MFKLLVLSALVAVAVAAPHHTAGVWQVAHHETALPVVYDAAEVVVAAHQQPEYAHVGSVVDHYPSAVSHQSRTDYHSTPVVKSVLAPVEYVQPVVHHHQAPATTLVYSAPIVHQQIAHHQPLVYSSQPLLHSAGHQLVQAW